MQKGWYPSDSIQPSILCSINSFTIERPVVEVSIVRFTIFFFYLSDSEVERSRFSWRSELCSLRGLLSWMSDN